MTLSRGLRATLTLFTVVVLVVIYMPLVLVILNSFNTDRTFGWPPPGSRCSGGSWPGGAEGARDALWTAVKVALLRHRDRAGAGHAGGDGAAAHPVLRPRTSSRC